MGYGLAPAGLVAFGAMSVLLRSGLAPASHMAFGARSIWVSLGLTPAGRVAFGALPVTMRLHVMLRLGSATACWCGSCLAISFGRAHFVLIVATSCLE